MGIVSGGSSNDSRRPSGMEALVLVKGTGKAEEIAAMMLDVMWQNGKEETFITVIYHILCTILKQKHHIVYNSNSVADIWLYLKIPTSYVFCTLHGTYVYLIVVVLEAYSSSRWCMATCGWNGEAGPRKTDGGWEQRPNWSTESQALSI